MRIAQVVNAFEFADVYRERARVCAISVLPHDDDVVAVNIVLRFLCPLLPQHITLLIVPTKVVTEWLRCECVCVLFYTSQRTHMALSKLSFKTVYEAAKWNKLIDAIGSFQCGKRTHFSNTNKYSQLRIG